MGWVDANEHDRPTDTHLTSPQTGLIAASSGSHDAEEYARQLVEVRRGLSVAAIGILAGLYPAVWSVGQLYTGALSDRVGRKWLIAGGMLLQGAAIALIAATSGFGAWAFGAVLLGAGTAMVYSTLLAAIGDVAHPTWRASSVGIYRFWRDAR